MNKIKLTIGAVLSGMALSVVVASPAFAWHPQGYITKKVQNQTTKSSLVDADSVSTALAVKPGDTLKYVVTVGNKGAADSRGYNDMAKTVFKDALPAGVELISNPSQRDVTFDLGTVKPGASVTKEILVKVTSTKDGETLDNKACFLGNSTANDNPQGGCDDAIVKVSVPPKPVVVTPPTQPQVLPAATTTELPKTGAGSAIAIAAIAAAVGYVSYLVVLKRKNA